MDKKCEKIEQVLERIEKIFAEIKELVRGLRNEEERSHREREKMHVEMLNELRRIREILDEIRVEIIDVKSRYRL